MKLYYLLLTTLAASAIGKELTVTIHFPESELSEVWHKQPDAEEADKIFGLNYYSCQDRIHTSKCPGGQASFDSDLWIRRTDKIAPDTWRKKIVFDSEVTYQGSIVLDIFAPLPLNPQVFAPLFCGSSVTACANTRQSYEMGNEICPQIGNPWTFKVDFSKESKGISTESINLYPSFGFGSGNTSILLPNFYSPQLKNKRDIPVYIPPTLVQNKIKRTVNVLFLLDATAPVVEDFATRAGFETGQQMGDVPESIMIGISQLSFMLAGNPNQRSLELTYGKEVDPSTSDSCIKSGPDATGDADLLIEFIIDTLLPAVFTKLNMDLGEVSVAGGSLGGLFSCYAAAARPDIFKRAICMSYSNCFKATKEGYFNEVVTKKALESKGVKPKAVMMMFGAEVYAHNPKNGPDPSLGDDQLGHLMKDLSAWEKDYGMTVMEWGDFQTIGTSDEVRVKYGLAEKEVPDNLVVAFLRVGGQHCPGSWSQYFHASLQTLYRPQPSDPQRVPILNALKFITYNGTTPVEANASSNPIMIASLVAASVGVLILSGVVFKLCRDLKKISSENNNQYAIM